MIKENCSWCCLSEEEKRFLLYEGRYWDLFLSDEQDYIGRCVLVLKRHCGSLSELTDGEWEELRAMIRRTEACLKAVMGAALCNWSCLLNSFYKDPDPDPHLHIHVRPRYDRPVTVNGNIYTDEGFGHHYALKKDMMLPEEDREEVFSRLKGWLDRFFAFFSGFPTHHFPDGIAATLGKEIPAGDDLVFVSAWPSDHPRNDADAAGMHEMFAEQDIGFKHFHVIDDRTYPEQAVKLITEASCIFLMGGNATEQMRLIREKGIRDSLISCSAATLGVSAGAMNMGRTTVDIWESPVPYEGLGFADITVIGHFDQADEERMDLMKRVSIDRPVCAMADGSAIFIRNGDVSCTGEIHWIERGEIVDLSTDMIKIP